jgi:hypothetical protein
MNSISIFGVQGVDPMAAQDGLMSMLLDGGEEFAAQMDAELMSSTSSMLSGALDSDVSEEEVDSGDGLALMVSELPADTLNFWAGQTQLDAANTPFKGEGMGGGSGVPLQQDLGTENQSLESVVDASLLEGLPEGMEPGVELSQTDLSMEAQAVDTVTSSLSTEAVKVASGPGAGAASSKEASGLRRVSSRERIDSLEQVAKEEKSESIESAAESVDVDAQSPEILEDWDSSHLNLEPSMDELSGANPSAFTRPGMPVVESAMNVQQDSIEVADSDGKLESLKETEKNKVHKTEEAQVELEEFEDNPADARVELSDQRSVRVVVDQDLAVEIIQDGDAVDVVVEGPQEVAEDMKDVTPELSDALDQSGFFLRDFSTRQDSSTESNTQNNGGDQNESAEESAGTTTPHRGRTVNVVA